MTGRYCSACGQERIDPQDLSARRFVGELAGEVNTLGLRFPTLRTLRGLLIPGELTTEFLAGRRQPYLSPVKVYFLCAAIFFLVAPIAGFTSKALVADDRSGDLRRLMSARASAHAIDPAIIGQRFDVRLPSVYTLALGSGVIAIALTLQLLFRRGLPFGAHVVFALHYFAFLYLVTAAAGLGRRFGLTDELAAALAIAVIIPYVCFALRRAYPERILWTLLKSAIVVLATLGINFVADFAATRLTIAML